MKKSIIVCIAAIAISVAFAENTSLGYRALNLTENISSTTAIGEDTISNGKEVNRSIAVGGNALMGAANVSECIAIGNGAMAGAHDMIGSVAIGSHALQDLALSDTTVINENQIMVSKPMNAFCINPNKERDITDTPLYYLNGVLHFNAPVSGIESAIKELYGEVCFMKEHEFYGTFNATNINQTTHQTSVYVATNNLVDFDVALNMKGESETMSGSIRGGCVFFGGAHISPFSFEIPIEIGSDGKPVSKTYSKRENFNYGDFYSISVSIAFGEDDNGKTVLTSVSPFRYSIRDTHWIYGPSWDEQTIVVNGSGTIIIPSSAINENTSHKGANLEYLADDIVDRKDTIVTSSAIRKMGEWTRGCDWFVGWKETDVDNTSVPLLKDIKVLSSRELIDEFGLILVTNHYGQYDHSYDTEAFIPRVVDIEYTYANENKVFVTETNRIDMTMLNEYIKYIPNCWTFYSSTDFREKVNIYTCLTIDEYGNLVFGAYRSDTYWWHSFGSIQKSVSFDAPEYSERNEYKMDGKLSPMTCSSTKYVDFRLGGMTFKMDGGQFCVYTNGVKIGTLTFTPTPAQ